MMRRLILLPVLAATMALPAIAQQGTKPSTIVTDKAPAMTTDSMDNKAPAAPATTAASTEKAVPSLMLTSEEAKAWVGKPVYSSDGENLGSVAALIRSDDGKVTELQADIGGFLGIGEHGISVTPAQFNLETDRVVLELTSEQAEALPKIAK